MSASVEFQDVVLGLLKADAGVAAIVGDRVYDEMPSDGAYPCVTLGDSDSVPEDADCITSRSETVQVDGWVDAQGRRWPARQLADAIKSALHEADASMVTHALVSMRVVLTRVMKDPDGIRAHAVVQVTGLIEER